MWNQQISNYSSLKDNFFHMGRDASDYTDDIFWVKIKTISLLISLTAKNDLFSLCGCNEY